MHRVDLLKKLIRIDSSYPREANISGVLANLLLDIGCNVKTHVVEDERTNIVARKGTGEKSVIFYGHMDTVSPGNIKEVLIPIERGGKLYGLGSYDMKSGIVAILEAVSRFTPKNITVKVALGIDEEADSKGAHHLRKYGSSFFKDGMILIVPEPNFGKGLHSLVVGRAGRAVFDVVMKGKAAHIMHSNQAVDAIKALAVYLDEFYKQEPAIHPSLGSSLRFVREITGESIGMSIAGEATCQIECLMVPPETIKSVREDLVNLGIRLKKEGKLKIVPKISLVARETPYLEPFYQESKSIPFKEILDKIITKHTGKHVNFYSRVSVGDENVFAKLNIPVVTWGPDGGNAHVDGEYVELDSVEKLSKMFLEFLQEVDKSA